jgi:hypothetical protein
MAPRAVVSFPRSIGALECRIHDVPVRWEFRIPLGPVTRRPRGSIDLPDVDGMKFGKQGIGEFARAGFV